MRLAFLTGTPLNIYEGSGTFNGIATLARALQSQGCQVEMFTPARRLPVYTLERLWFNRQLQHRDLSGFDAVVGFDMDGYLVRTGRPHIASIKGVIADEMRFEQGITRASMAFQAACERRHVQRAGIVFTTSQYAARRIRELYSLATAPEVIPEAIDLPRWRDLLARNPATPDPARFTVLCVCRFYPRKRLDVLLDATALLRADIPSLEVRIAGGGPQRAALLRQWKRLGLQETVHWLDDIPQDVLAREYQRCDLFCLPSVQEGFGIVFLEAMAAGKPVVAARASAVPEVLPQGLLAEPGDARAVAAAIARLYADPALRTSLTQQGLQQVMQFDASLVARQFLDRLSRA